MQTMTDQEENLNGWFEENSNFDFMSVPVQPVVVVESKPPSFVNNSLSNLNNVTVDDVDIGDFFESEDNFAATSDKTADEALSSYQNIALRTISNEELSGAFSGQSSLQSNNNAYRLYDGLNKQQSAIVEQRYKTILPKEDRHSSLISSVSSSSVVTAIQLPASPNINPKRNSDEHSSALNSRKRKNRNEKTPQQRSKDNLSCRNSRAKKKKYYSDLEENNESQAKTIKEHEEKIEKLKQEKAELQSQLKTRDGQMYVQKLQIQIQNRKIDEQKGQLDIQQQKIAAHEQSSSSTVQTPSTQLSENADWQNVNELKEQIKNLRTSVESEKYRRISLENGFSERLSVLEAANSMDQIMNASLEEEVDKRIVLGIAKRLETLEEHLLPTSGKLVSATCREPDLTNVKRFLRNLLARVDALEESVHSQIGKDL